jgi:drug/metabolite transporter (DMT)-like permease
MPCAAVVFAALFLRERVTFLLILGGIAILAGVIVVQKRQES